MSPGERGSGPSWLQRIGLLAAGIVVALVIVEIFIRVWAATVAAHGDVPAPAGDRIVVLCIGDSHTWGRGHGYPERLSTALARRSERYRVVNLGVSGTNTAQLRRRLPQQMDRYGPALLVVWSGVNNAWNRADADVRSGEGAGSVWQWLAERSRILRFVRVWRHGRLLREAFEADGAYVAPRAEQEDEPGFSRHVRVLAGASEEYENRTGATLSDDELVAATRDDLIWIVEYAQDRGVPTILISYGLSGLYGEASRGIREAGAATGAPVIDAADVAKELLARMGAGGAWLAPLYDDTIHPTQPLYEAVGNRVLAVADVLRLLPQPD